MPIITEVLAAELKKPSRAYDRVNAALDLSGMTSLDFGSLYTAIEQAIVSDNPDARALGVFIRDQATRMNLAPVMNQTVFLDAVRGSNHMGLAIRYFVFLNEDLPEGVEVEARRLMGDPTQWFNNYSGRYYQAHFMARLAGVDIMAELRQAMHENYRNAPVRLLEFDVLSQVQVRSALALATSSALQAALTWVDPAGLFDGDPALALASDPAYLEFSREVLTHAAGHIEDIHAGRVAYKSDAAFSTEDSPVMARAASIAALRDEPWFRDVIAGLLPKLCYAPTEAKTAPSQSLAIALGQMVEAMPTPEGVQALREAIREVRHAGLKKKLMRHIKPAERKLIERTDIVRPAPRFGLDESGTTALDFGARQFFVSFDETLKPYVKDGHGVRLKDLPKPLKSDDAVLAEATVARFKQLKADVKTVASLQLTQLELAMCAGRRWSVAEFGEFFLHHPLMWHLAARLVWCAQVDGLPEQYFRIAEDRSLADCDDVQYRLAEGARVGIAHMLNMPEPVFRAFGQIFSDYEILQPFRQLTRETHTLNEDELNTPVLTQFNGKTVSIGSLMGLFNRGWKRGDTEDGGYIYYFTKRLDAGHEASIELSPGVHVSDMRMNPIQELGRLTVQKQGDRFGNAERVPFSTLDRVTISEILRDIDLMAPLKE